MTCALQPRPTLGQVFLLLAVLAPLYLVGQDSSSGHTPPSIRAKPCPCRHLKARVRKFTHRYFDSSRYRLHKTRIEPRLSAGNVHAYMLVIPSTRRWYNWHAPVICRDTAFFATRISPGIGADFVRVRQAIDRILLSPTPPDTATIHTVHRLFRRGSGQYPKEGVHVHWR